jgi:N,N'-diacetyllegionaminate synthase
MKLDKVLIIAEAGVNHNGNMDTAKELIDVAVDAGANIVKFQSFKAENLVSKKARKAEYQVQNTGDDVGQYEMLKELELNFEDAKKLKNYSKSKGIKFLSTPFDIDSIEELVQAKLIDRFKVPSGEIINLQYLRKIADYELPVILSTGMSSLKEVAEAVDILLGGGNLTRDDITVLHCNTEYPTPVEDVNLNAMLTIKEALKVPVGYSDHTEGIEIPTAAATLGASIIEKHFTLDKTMPGPDHKASLEPKELKAMVKSIRNVETAMGNGIKRPSSSETKNIETVRKSIHIKKQIQSGKKLTADHLITRRPARGISPMHIDLVIGRKVAKDLEPDDTLNWSDLA